jgi:hypothetical protein
MTIDVGAVGDAIAPNYSTDGSCNETVTKNIEK